MDVLYLTSGLTGTGRLVQGISVGNALLRRKEFINYTIVSSCSFGFLADRFKITHTEIPFEDEVALGKENYHKSILYSTLVSKKPDVLVVDLLWPHIHSFINELDCKKIFLCRQVFDNFFRVPMPQNEITFRPDDYDLIFATEPFKSSIPMKQINPILIRNRDEILSRKKALDKLNLDGFRKNCLFAFNGEPGEFERVKRDYSYLESEGYNMVYSTNYQGGLFPAVDYFNAFDLIICGAGYNAFWEVVYFNKEAIFVPVLRLFESQERRVVECQEFYFKENGADQLVDIIMNL